MKARLVRAAEHHEVMTLIAKPKPKKEDRPKKNKNHVHGICPQCAVIFHSKIPQHNLDCPQEIPVIMVKKNQTERQLLNMALDVLLRLLTEWRDGCVCVLMEVDGARCSTTSQWGHVIPQGGSGYLVHNLSNSFRQCSSHNIIHDKINPLLYSEWYRDEFGTRAIKMLNEAAIAKFNGFSIMELYEALAENNNLYSQRFMFANATKAEKIYAGFYGDIIHAAWVKEGKI